MKFQPVNHGNDIIVYPSGPLQRVLGATAERLESLQSITLNGPKKNDSREVWWVLKEQSLEVGRQLSWD